MKKISLILSFLLVITSQAREFEYAESEIPLEGAYPLITNNMLPKQFATKELSEKLTAQSNRTFPASFCVIGNDPISIAWLNEPMTQIFLKNFTRDGYCLAINLQSFDDFIDIKNIFEKLGVGSIPLIPMKLDGFVKEYEINQYPFIFSPSSGVFLQTTPK